MAVYWPVRWLAWVFLAVGVAVVAAGEISYDLIATGVGTDEFPSLVDVLYLATYPPLAIGLLWLGVARAPSRDVTAMIDTAALSLAGSLIVWVVLVRPTVDSLHLTGAVKVVAVAGWVGDAVVVAAAARFGHAVAAQHGRRVTRCCDRRPGGRGRALWCRADSWDLA